MNRKTVTFPVRVESFTPDYARLVRWLRADGELTENADEAIRFTVYRSPVPGERFKIDGLMHDLAGGLEAWLDLEKGIDNARKALVGGIEARLWPDGRPEATGEAMLKQQAQIGQAWEADDSPLRRGLSTMLAMQDRLRFLASWKVLGVEMPAEWQSLAERELPELVFQAIWRAYMEAVDASFLEQQRSSAR